MKKLYICSLLCIISGLQFLPAQSVFKGTVGKAPVEFALYVYSDDVAEGYYTYLKYDTPIALTGKRELNKVLLEEKDAAGKVTATLLFENLREESVKIEGSWRPVNGGKEVPIHLEKVFELDYKQGTIMNRSMYGNESVTNHYFMLHLDKKAEDFEAQVVHVLVKEKKTDRLIQTIDTDCNLRFPGMIFTGDYNFDGHTDFSVLVGSGAGPNTWSNYYFYDPATGRYNFFEPFSEMSSLDFFPETKIIGSFNKSGMSSRSSEWRFREDGTLEMLNETCMELKEETESWEEVDCE